MTKKSKKETVAGEQVLGSHAEEAVRTKEEETASPLAWMAGKTLMYVGPTVPGLGIQNRVYRGEPVGAADFVAKEPEIGNLFIEISKYPEAGRMLREKNGYIYRAYMKALALANKKKGGK